MEIDEEDKELSWAEKAEKTLQLLEKDLLWERLKSRVTKQGSARSLHKEIQSK
ncbi:MAG: hypothetical protein ABIJ56_08960 [Pseudomonadota bacterium]